MNGHSLGMLAGALGTALAAFLAVDPLSGHPEVAQALTGLVAALAALSVALQRIYPPAGGEAPSPQPPPSP